MEQTLKWEGERRGSFGGEEALITFSLGAEDEDSQGGDHLKLVVPVQSNLLYHPHWDQAFGVHLLDRQTDETVKHTGAHTHP